MKTDTFFVTGTDTSVGKTYVTALLLAELRRQGFPAGAMKPIACGRDGREDAKQYVELMDHEQPLDVLNPIYLRQPLAPSVAAKLAGRRLDLRPVFSRCRSLMARHHPFFIEGAGGLLVPIRRDYFIADLARDIGAPLLIVARLGLGTINHTLLTVRQAQALGLPVAGIILNDTVGGCRGLAERTNISVVPRLCGVPLLGVIPHGHAGKAVREICGRLRAIS